MGQKISIIGSRANQIHNAPVPTPATPYRILSISGGGTKIIYFFAILEAILVMYNNCYPDKNFDHITPFFDMISGTSAGSILSMIFQLQIPFEQVRDIIFEACKQIFGQTSQAKYLCLIKNGYMYDNRKFIEFAKRYCGDKKVSDV